MNPRRSPAVGYISRWFSDTASSRIPVRVGWSVTRGRGQRVAAPAPGKKARCRGRRSRCCRCSSDRDGDEGVVGRDQSGRREKWPGCSRFLSAGSLGAPRAERICFSIAVRRNLPFLVPPNSIARARHHRSPLLVSSATRYTNRSTNEPRSQPRRASRSCSRSTTRGLSRNALTSGNTDR